MPENLFLIHIVLLVILTVVFAIAGILCVVGYYNDQSQFAGVFFKKKKWLGYAFLSFLLSIGGLSWWIATANQPWRTSLVTLHEIKDVTWPDGTKSQMFNCDGEDHNVTVIFQKIVDKDGWVVKRIRWNPLYLGVSWSTTRRCARDLFYLEDKSNPNKSVEL